MEIAWEVGYYMASPTKRCRLVGGFTHLEKY
jgi:hypothetical protein